MRPANHVPRLLMAAEKKLLDSAPPIVSLEERLQCFTTPEFWNAYLQIPRDSVIRSWIDGAADFLGNAKSILYFLEPLVTDTFHEMAHRCGDAGWRHSVGEARSREIEGHLAHGRLDRCALLTILAKRSRTLGFAKWNILPRGGGILDQAHFWGKALKNGAPFVDFAYDDPSHGVFSHLIQMIGTAEHLDRKFSPHAGKGLFQAFHDDVHRIRTLWIPMFDCKWRRLWYSNRSIQELFAEDFGANLP